MGSSSFHMSIYPRSEQCDLGPIYTLTNTHRIRIYPGKLKFILVKISPDPGRLHGKHAKENQTLSTYLGNYLSTFFCVLIFIRIDRNLHIASKRIEPIRTNICKVLQFIRVNLPGVNRALINLKVIKSCSFT